MLGIIKKIAMGAAMPLLLSVLLPSAPAFAADQAATGTNQNNPAVQGGVHQNGTMQQGATQGTKAQPEARSDAQDLVREASTVVTHMKRDPKIEKLLKQAKGVFIVPDYAKGALLVGARGGSGVMLARTSNGWSDPAFYDIGGISAGAQAGFSAGQIALILMNDKAVNEFRQNNNFSLNGQAGFVIANYSARAEGTLGNSDIVVWSNTSGALADVSIGVSDIKYDTEQNQIYYGQNATADAILSGKEQNPKAQQLTQELPG